MTSCVLWRVSLVGRRLPALLWGLGRVAALVLSIALSSACAEEAASVSLFDEQRVEFQNDDVTLAGTLLLPTSEASVPAVVLVHGAGRATRKAYREVAVFWASRGIAALIYDKRGTGESGGAYESREPYTNLVNDLLGAVDFLKHRPEIDASQIGLWGLSQGATISATAASRSDDLRFLIVVGADVADGSLFHYRDNLFRKYGLSSRLRDIAEKLHLVDQDLQNTFREGFRLSLLTSRTYPSAEHYVHPAWSRVTTPVLAMWGELDQNIPVAESVAGLKNSLAQAQNRRWTIIIQPGTNHDLKISATGELQSQSQGYPPGALDMMADWARTVMDRPTELETGRQEGTPRAAGVLPRLQGYERLRWYGNGPVQASLWILFFVHFSRRSIASLASLVIARLRRSHPGGVPATRRFQSLTKAICGLDWLILVTFSITAVLAVDQLHPRCPSVLQFVPLLGSISTLATAGLLIQHLRTPRNMDTTARPALRVSLDLLVLILFVPYMLYWNLVGTHF